MAKGKKVVRKKKEKKKMKDGSTGLTTQGFMMKKEKSTTV